MHIRQTRSFSTNRLNPGDASASNTVELGAKPCRAVPTAALHSCLCSEMGMEVQLRLRGSDGCEAFRTETRWSLAYATRYSSPK